MKLFISIFAACVIVFPIYMISVAIHGSKRRIEKAKQKAIAQGHVVNAVLVKRSAPRSNVPGTYSKRARLGTYEYKYKGKVYKYRFWDEMPPSTLTLYFLKNPRKATTEGGLSDSKVCWPLVYLVVALLAYWIMNA